MGRGVGLTDAFGWLATGVGVGVLRGKVGVVSGEDDATASDEGDGETAVLRNAAGAATNMYHNPAATKIAKTTALVMIRRWLFVSSFISIENMLS